MNEPFPVREWKRDRWGKQGWRISLNVLRLGRHGEMAAKIASESKYDNSLVCE